MKTGLPLALLALLAAQPVRAEAPAADPSAACERAAATAEQAHGLPAGILSAIGRVESGRRDPLTGGVHPWPWTIDGEGTGAMFPTREAALVALAELQKAGMRSIDVGCFQVNLQQHPQAFATPADGFDPERNADYAARFLAELQQRSGNWPDAVMAYHSASPSRGIPYRDRVLASWAAPAAQPALALAFALPPAVSIPGLHVWTPAAAGTAPAVIALAQARGALPIVHRLTNP